jgi:branched-chain amino acid aminotransferase
MLTSAADRAATDSEPYIAPGVLDALKNFKLPEKLGFGAVSAPIMFTVDWADGRWGRGRLVPYGPIEILPGARALQYAELVFEGLKAYRIGGEHPNLFRPRENWLRLARSAERLSMPPVPEALFFQAIDAVAASCSATRRHSHSWSLRIRWRFTPQEQCASPSSAPMCGRR